MLPVDSILPELNTTLEHSSIALLQAPPGSGKTTRVPLALLDATWRQQRKILVLEPRRLAARSVARFMAQQLDEPVGQTVGYRTRLDSKISSTTQIEVVTEGILTRLIQHDPQLENYAIVIFDEFHERSLQADLGLALILEAQLALRDDLRILVMSATLNTEPLARVLGEAPLISTQGRSFPVEVLYQPPRSQHWLDALVNCIHAALREQSGSILVFLPGVGEIRRVAERLAPLQSDSILLAPLYGNLSSQKQDEAIQPAPNGMRKIVLATSIAETSLTIEGIRVVIDSGQQRRAVFNPNSGTSQLITSRVSKAAAEQRKGRAGRIEPGVCYRLWSADEHLSLPEFTPPEILEADLASVVLELAQWGAREPTDLAWVNTPPQAHWDQAKQLLQTLRLLDAHGAITELGKAARELGLHPRLATMVLQGRTLGLGKTAAQLAALLSERDILSNHQDSDMHERIRVLNGETSQPIDKARVHSVKQAAQQLCSDKESRIPSPEDAGRLLAFAYPDRLGKQRKNQSGRYQLSNGKGATLRASDSLAGNPWLVAAELDGKSKEATIFLAAPITLADIEHDHAHLIHEYDDISWDEQRGTVRARRVRMLGQLLLSEHELAKPTAEQYECALLNAVRNKGLSSLPWDNACLQWRARVALLHQLYPEQWPNMSDSALIDRIAEWLQPFLQGMRRWDDLKQLALWDALNSQLDYTQQRQLEQLAPSTLTIPTGQQVQLDYCAENGPVLAAKLQALFGWEYTPRLINGQIPVLIHLLSPAQRPLAVTSDLHSFWRNAYPEVRKDMRGRYPKHPWPEDPLTASAQQGVKRRKTQ